MRTAGLQGQRGTWPPVFLVPRLRNLTLDAKVNIPLIDFPNPDCKWLY